MKKRLLSCLLCLAVVCALVPAPAAAFEDTQGHWAAPAIQRWSGEGVLQGSGGRFRPGDLITRAELAAVLDRLMGYQVPSQAAYPDLPAGAWYEEAVRKAAHAGVMRGDGALLRPLDSLTRQEAAVLLGRALGAGEDASALRAYSDAGEAASWATGYLGGLSAAGVLRGSGGKIMPAAPITRAEVAQLLDNAVSARYAAPGAYSADADGNVIVSAPEVTLSHMTVGGSLIVAEGVGDGALVLDSVRVLGRLIVRGGGEHSIIIKGGSSVSSVAVERRDGKVRVAVEGDASVEVIYVDDGSDAVKVEGSVGSVTVSGAGASVEIAGEVGRVELTESAAGAALTVAEDARVDSVTTAAPESTVAVAGTVSALSAAGSAANAAVTVSETARVDTLATAAQGSSVSVSGQVGDLSVAEGASAAAVTVADGAKITSVTVAAPRSELAVAGTVARVEVAQGAAGTSISAETGARIDSVTTNAAGTTVQGEKGTVGRVTADKDATGTTVNAGGAKVENNSSDKVTSGTGSIDAGKTGTSQGEASRPSTGSGGTSGSGGGGGTSTKYYTVTYLCLGELLGTEQVASGNHPTGAGITVPTKTGYTFTGWRTKTSDGWRFPAEPLSGITVSGNLTLTAWLAVSPLETTVGTGGIQKGEATEETGWKYPLTGELSVSAVEEEGSAYYLNLHVAVPEGTELAGGETAITRLSLFWGDDRDNTWNEVTYTGASLDSDGKYLDLTYPVAGPDDLFIDQEVSLMVFVKWHGTENTTMGGWVNEFDLSKLTLKNEKEYEAQIGSTGYDTLASALEEAGKIEGGADVWLRKNVTIASGASLSVPTGVCLNVPEEYTLSVAGTLTINESLRNEGTVTVSGTLANENTVWNYGTIQTSNGGKVTNSGEFRQYYHYENSDWACSVTLPTITNSNGAIIAEFNINEEVEDANTALSAAVAAIGNLSESGYTLYSLSIRNAITISSELTLPKDTVLTLLGGSDRGITVASGGSIKAAEADGGAAGCVELISFADEYPGAYARLTIQSGGSVTCDLYITGGQGEQFIVEDGGAYSGTVYSRDTQFDEYGNGVQTTVPESNSGEK